MKTTILLFLLSALPAFAAEPTLAEFQARLDAILAKRETVVSDYRLGKAMMDLAVLKEAALISEQKALETKIEQMKTVTSPEKKAEAK